VGVEIKLYPEADLTGEQAQLPCFIQALLYK
jgi:hypothetical protein